MISGRWAGFILRASYKAVNLAALLSEAETG